ncbi:MAG: hypothetical protein WCF85_11385 [Rhodospirillaceae bacterium]
MKRSPIPANDNDNRPKVTEEDLTLFANFLTVPPGVRKQLLGIAAPGAGLPWLVAIKPTI